MQDTGFLLIDKPEGITSFNVIAELRKITRIRKIGHTGTLDPFASGLLLIAVGNATRFIEFFGDDVKTYEVIAEFGKKTDTGDITGEIIQTDEDKPVNETDIKQIPDKVKQITEQIPPVYSAIKIDGKRAYSLARKQIEVTMPSRSIRIYEFAILEFQYPQLKYTCTVSKGTYIRSLTETIGEMLGTIATTTSLRRTRIGNHSIEEGIPLHNLDNGNWKNNLIPIEKILDKFEHLSLNPEQGKAFCNGMQIGMENSVKEGKYLILIQGNLIGIGEIRNSVLSPKKVIG